MAGGRPSLYSDDMLASAQEYIDSGYEENGELFPSQVGLALYLNIGRQTAIDWSKDETKPEFSYIFEKVMMKQELDIVKNAITGEYNSTIAKVMLTKHGYSDKQQTELTGANGGPLEATWTVLPVKPKDA